MADEEKIEHTTAGEPAQGGGKKKKIMAVGGVVAALALAFVGALMAVPSKSEAPTLKGPFVAPLTTDKVRVNLAGGSSKRILLLEMNVKYKAYDPKYFDMRAADPVYLAELKAALLRIAATKTLDDVTLPDRVPAFEEEMRVAVERLLFPIHVGDGKLPLDADGESGLAPSEKMERSLFRGLWPDHAVHIDAPKGLMRIDDGPEVQFDGTEVDLAVPAGPEVFVYLDVSGLDPTFQGSVALGNHGRVMRLLGNDWIIQ
jgi:hypothetical protein